MKKPYSREVRTKLERLQMQLDAVKAAINGEALRDIDHG